MLQESLFQEVLTHTTTLPLFSQTSDWDEEDETEEPFDLHANHVPEQPHAPLPTERHLKERTDFDLIDLTIQGERAAFEVLVERYRGSIYALAFRMLRNQEDAADIVQDVFFKAYEALATFRKKSSFHTWLYRIATNSCINYLRKYSAQQQIELATYHAARQSDTLDSLYKLELQDVVNTAIDKLPEKQKATVILRVCEGLSHREVSRKLSCSVGTAKANYFHAIRNLRRFMKNYISANLDLSIPGNTPGTNHPYTYA